MTTERSAVHATCLVLGEAGILITGASGAGKTSLALALIAEGAARGTFARLVADDRTLLSVAHGRLIGRAHPAIAGQVEVRHVGILPWPHERAARIRCVIALCQPAPDRLPEPGEMLTLRGVSLPVLRLPAAGGETPHAAMRSVLAFMSTSIGAIAP